jgi:hypothetical protein
VVLHRQRLHGPCGDGDVGSTGDLQQGERIAGRHVGVGVAEHGGEAHHFELGRFEGIEDRHRVVDAGIGVDQDLAALAVGHQRRT